MEIDANGSSFNCRIDGQQGPWVLLSHGLATDLSMWDELTDALKDRFRVIRYDARDGFVLFAPQFTGGRGWQEMTTGMCEKEHTVHEIVEALGPDYVAVDLREKMK